MHFAGRLGGWLGQKYLWQLAATNALHVHSPTHDEQMRMRSLMQKYQNVPGAARGQRPAGKSARLERSKRCHPFAHELYINVNFRFKKP
ncbi:MAG: hypothetical protein HC930_08390 [Hydrococcus sp. SU_1_0]|nr:hypothetical protein [Hydrococcus sp. SU_1_0]